MDSTNISESEKDETNYDKFKARELLFALNNEYKALLLPAISFFYFAIFLGTFGNVAIVALYGFRMKLTSQNILVSFLGLIDLITCSVCIPSETVVLRNVYVFEASKKCTILRFFGGFTHFCSVFLIFTISIDRYRKICFPLNRQISELEAKQLVIAILILSCLSSWPILLIYGLRTQHLHGIAFQNCLVSDSSDNSIITRVYAIVLLVFYGILYFIIALVYFKMWKSVHSLEVTQPIPPRLPLFVKKVSSSSLKKTSKKSQSSGTSKPFIDLSVITRLFRDKDNQEEHSDKTDGSGKTESNNEIETLSNASLSLDNFSIKKEEILSSTIVHPKQDQGFRGDYSNLEVNYRVSQMSIPKPPKNSKKRKIVTQAQIKIVILACCITIFFLFTCLPYVVLFLLLSNSKNYDFTLKGNSFLIFHFFLRSYVFHSVVNPIIYGFLNPQFRSLIFELFPCFRTYE